MHYELYMLLFIVCLPLVAPDNGNIDCSLDTHNRQDTCTFTCNDGFRLEGSVRRTCQFSNRRRHPSWNGNEAHCVPGKHRMFV